MKRSGAARGKKRRGAIVPRVVLLGACATAVIPSAYALGCSDDTTDTSGNGGGASVAAGGFSGVAAGGFAAVAAGGFSVAAGGFAAVAAGGFSVAAGGFGGAGGGKGGAGGAGGTGRLDAPGGGVEQPYDAGGAVSPLDGRRPDRRVETTATRGKPKGGARRG